MANGTGRRTGEVRAGTALHLVGQAVLGIFAGASRAVAERLIKLFSD
ncbi:hypothetical protein [Embleya scabrispora]|nr:hypothetical protein [Embleya scabrispora]MYS87784.1 hypothetical protein [Streptomyces sp. SID5474]